MTTSDIKVTCAFGHADLQMAYRYEEEALVCYGWSRHFDINGRLVYETVPQELSRVTWCDAPKQQSVKKRGFLSRLMSWCSNG